MLKLYNYPSCSTCRRAISWLKKNDIDFELIDLIKNPPSQETLILASKEYGDRKYLLNTTGAMYRSIGAEVVKEMNDKEFFERLYKEPKLIKRPFLYRKNSLFLIGFKEEKWVEKLL